MQDKTGRRSAVTDTRSSMKMTDRLSSYGRTPFSTLKCTINPKLLIWECDSIKWDLSCSIRKHTVRVRMALVTAWLDHYLACLVWINDESSATVPQSIFMIYLYYYRFYRLKLKNEILCFIYLFCQQLTGFWNGVTIYTYVYNDKINHWKSSIIKNIGNCIRAETLIQP